MNTLERMTAQLMTTMATGADLKRYNDDFTDKIEVVQNSVSEHGNAVGKLDNKVTDIDSRVNACEESGLLRGVLAEGRGRRTSRRRRRMRKCWERTAPPAGAPRHRRPVDAQNRPHPRLESIRLDRRLPN